MADTALELSKQAAPATRRTGGARSHLGHAQIVAHRHRRQQYGDRLFLCRHGDAVLPAGGHSRSADAAATRRAQQYISQPGDLQPDLHDARHRDDVPVRRSRGRGDGHPPAAPDARRPRPAFSAAGRLCVLGLLCRRADFLQHAVLRPRALRRMVHVSAAHQFAILARHGRGFLAAGYRLHRDFSDRRRDRDHRRRAAHPRTRHDARQDADVRVDDADLRRNDRVRVSGRHPRHAAARTRARLRLAVLHRRQRRRRAALATSVLVLRPSRGLHHLPAGGRHGVDDRAGHVRHAARRLSAASWWR